MSHFWVPVFALDGRTAINASTQEGARVGRACQSRGVGAGRHRASRLGCVQPLPNGQPKLGSADSECRKWGGLGLQSDLQRLQFIHRHVPLQKASKVTQQVILAGLAERQPVDRQAAL